MKILIFGKDGQLGKAFQSLAKSYARHQWIFLGRTDIDLSKAEYIIKYLEQAQPDLVINAAAYTAVDKAQDEQDLTMAINAIAPQMMARYCAHHNANFVHFSSDYVFDGTKDGWYEEGDVTNPLGIYGQSKLAGEELIAQSFAHCRKSNFWIFRTSWVYGEGNNFIRTMLKLGSERCSLRVIDDQYGVPTSADFLAQISLQISIGKHGDSSSERVSSGVYHCVPSGQTSWHGLASSVIAKAHFLGMALSCPVNAIEAIPASAYPLPAPRPHNSKMDTGKICKALNVDGLPKWQEFVDQYVEQYVFQLMKFQ